MHIAIDKIHEHKNIAKFGVGFAMEKKLLL